MDSCSAASPHRRPGAARDEQGNGGKKTCFTSILACFIEGDVFHLLRVLEELSRTCEHRLASVGGDVLTRMRVRSRSTIRGWHVFRSEHRKCSLPLFDRLLYWFVSPERLKLVKMLFLGIYSRW